MPDFDKASLPPEAGTSANPEVSTAAAPAKRGRGRPKGSKNKPKAEAPKKRGRPLGSKNKPKMDTTPNKRGRPKGSKNKLKAQASAKPTVPTVVASEKRGRGRPATHPVTYLFRILENTLTLSDKALFKLARNKLTLPKNKKQSGENLDKRTIVPTSTYVLRTKTEEITKNLYERKDCNPARISYAPALPPKTFATAPAPQAFSPAVSSADPIDEEIAANAFASTLNSDVSLNKKTLSRLFYNWLCKTDVEIKNYAQLKRIGSVLNVQKGYHVAIPTEPEFNNAVSRKAKRVTGMTVKPREQVYVF